jgi:hypothetical protein
MTPDTPTADGSRSADEAAPAQRASAPQPGRVAELGLVSAGLGLVIYLIGFVTDVGGTSSLVLPLLLGGGLLAGTVALPTVSSRVLAPAAVATTTGALLLLHAVVDDGGSALAVGALVLGLLEAGAAVGATLMQAGVLRSRPPKPRKSSAASPFSGYPDGPQFPGQQYPGQPYPGAYGSGAPAREQYPADQWTGEHAYGQNAQYGGQYGVPGYPPPPPSATPGYDVAHAPAAAAGIDAVGDATSPPRGIRAVTEPVAGAGDFGSGYRSAADPGTGAHRAAPDPAAGAWRTGSWPAAPEGTGTHRAVSGTGSHPSSAETPPVSGTGSYRAGVGGRLDDDGEHTRTLPAVPNEQR